MTIQRMDNVLIVVEDLDAVISFFVELGMELEGKPGPVEGRWVERVIGIDDVRQEVAMLRTPDGHGRIELAMFHTPKSISAEPKDAPANTLGIRRMCVPAQRRARIAGSASDRPTPNNSPSDRSRLPRTSSRTSTNASACSSVVISGVSLFL